MKNNITRNIFKEWLHENSYTIDQLKQLGNIEDLKLHIEVKDITLSDMEIITHYTYETSDGRTGMFAGYPIRSGMSTIDCMLTANNNFEIYIELARCFYNLELSEHSMRYILCYKDYSEQMNTYFATYHNAFNVISPDYIEDILSESSIEECDSYIFRYATEEIPGLIEKASEHQITLPGLDFTFIIRRERNLKWTHRCNVYFNFQGSYQSWQVFSFTYDLEKETINGEQELLCFLEERFDELLHQESSNKELVHIILNSYYTI